MNLEEYIKLAEKTLSTEFHSDSKMERILHASLGLATEIEELLVNYTEKIDPTNVLEECGDLTWYLSIFYREYGIKNFNSSEKSPNEIEPYDLIMDMLRNILKIQDIIKKKLYYNKPINEGTLIELILAIDSSIRDYLKYHNLIIEDVWNKNIAKLRARYGEKFTSERAINRDLETERVILENDDMISEPTFSRQDLVNVESNLNHDSEGNRRVGSIFPNNNQMF